MSTPDPNDLRDAYIVARSRASYAAGAGESWPSLDRQLSEARVSWLYGLAETWADAAARYTATRVCHAAGNCNAGELDQAEAACTAARDAFRAALEVTDD